MRALQLHAAALLVLEGWALTAVGRLGVCAKGGAHRPVMGTVAPCHACVFICIRAMRVYSSVPCAARLTRDQRYQGLD